MSKTYSISVRLKRVTIETAYVSVPLNADLLESGVIDEERLRQAALNLGHHGSTVWAVEGEPEVTLHPPQTPSG